MRRSRGGPLGSRGDDEAVALEVLEQLVNILLNFRRVRIWEAFPHALAKRLEGEIRRLELLPDERRDLIGAVIQLALDAEEDRAVGHGGPDDIRADARQ